jgi:hypothetical protein
MDWILCMRMLEKLHFAEKTLCPLGMISSNEMMWTTQNSLLIIFDDKTVHQSIGL